MHPKTKEKISQVMNLMKVLDLSIEAKQKINNDGIIENVIYLIDHEKYPEPEKGPAPDSPVEGNKAQPEETTHD